jgi:phage terminase small subunit
MEAYGTDNKRSASASASKLLKNPNIEAYINSLLAPAREKYGVTRDNVIRELANIGFNRATDIFNNDGSVRPVHQWPDSVQRSVKKLKFSTRTRPGDEDTPLEYMTEVEFYDKTAALRDLGRTMAMFTDNQRVGDPDGNPMRQIVVLPAKDAAD